MSSPLPMTAGRWVALAVGLPLALLAIGGTALTAVAYAGLGSYRVNVAVPVAGRTATMSMDNADIKVVPGPAGQIRVHGTLRYSLVKPYVSWRRTASGVAVHSSCRAPVGICLLDFAVTVPAAGRSAVSDASGDLTASGLAGTFTLNDGSGDITATRISGAPTVSDGSGDIVVTSLSGSRALIMDDSGDITASGVSASSLTATDQSGDITVTFSKVPDRVRISDASGDIALVLPPGPARYRVSASSSSGSTSVSVPRSLTSPHLVSATSQSGDISISQ
jgi:Putative adhesin